MKKRNLFFNLPEGSTRSNCRKMHDVLQMLQLGKGFSILWDRQIWLGSQRRVLFIAIIYMRIASFQILKHFEGVFCLFLCYFCFFVCFICLFCFCLPCLYSFFFFLICLSTGCLLPLHNTGDQVAYTQTFIFLRLAFDQLASMVS